MPLIYRLTGSVNQSVGVFSFFSSTGATTGRFSYKVEEDCCRGNLAFGAAFFFIKGISSSEMSSLNPISTSSFTVYY